jgi:hypothetical protein
MDDGKPPHASQPSIDWGGLLSLIMIIGGFCLAGFVLLIVF